jgi:transposase
MRSIKTTNENDRKRIYESYANGNSISEIANVMGMKKPTIRSIIDSFLQYGCHKAKIKGGARNIKLNVECKESIKCRLDDDCTLSLKDG